MITFVLLLSAVCYPLMILQIPDVNETLQEYSHPYPFHRNIYSNVSALSANMKESSERRQSSFAFCQIPFVNDSSDESVYIYWIPQHVRKERPPREQWGE